MKIPSHLKIGGHEVRVEVVPLEDCGQFDPKTNTISIANSLPRSQQEVTLIHEILHALNQNLDDGMSHIFLESLSQQLYQVFSDNHMLR